MDSIPWAVIGPLSGWGAFITLAFLVLRVVVRGDLIPRTTHERELRQEREARERAEHDTAEWRTEGRVKDAQIAEKDKQLQHMGEVGRLVAKWTEALQNVTGVRVDDGSP